MPVMDLKVPAAYHPHPPDYQGQADHATDPVSPREQLLKQYEPRQE